MKVYAKHNLDSLARKNLNFEFSKNNELPKGSHPLSIASNVESIHQHINRFPTTRYYGSKRRIIRWIYKNIKDLSFKKVLDGFGGTASVSLLFKAMGKEVTYHDALVFNTISAQAILANYNPIRSPNEVDNFFESVKPKSDFITKTFKGLYYTDDENAWLDGAISKIFSINSFEKRCVLLYCLFQACLKKRPFNLFHRANLYLRQNITVKKSFGNQTTWDTLFTVFAKRAYKEISKTIWNSGWKHCIMNPTDVSKIKPGYDLVYFDPPYVSLKGYSNDYLKRYHFLEGLMQYDRWSSLINHDYKTLSFHPMPHISEWNIKSKFKSRLFNLIKKHRNSIVVLSYIQDAYPSKDELLSFFSKNFSEVRVDDLDLSHALTKDKRKELLIIGVPR